MQSLNIDPLCTNVCAFSPTLSGRLGWWCAILDHCVEGRDTNFLVIGNYMNSVSVLSVECVPHKKSELMYSGSTVLLNKLIFFYCYNVILCKSVFICFIWLEPFHKSNHPSKHFDSSCNGVTDFSPLERLWE